MGGQQKGKETAPAAVCCAAQVRSTPPIRAPCTQQLESQWYLTGGMGCRSAVLVHSKAPPPHARTTPLPFPFPFSPSPSLPSLTHRQLISRLRDLPFFLTLYSLTLPAFSGYSLTLSAVLDALFWHPFTLVVPCSRHHPTFHDVPPRHSTRHSLSKSTLNSPQLVDGISTFFGLHHFFLAFIIIIFHSVLFPVWGFLYTKENTCLSDPLNFHVSDRREVLHDH